MSGKAPEEKDLKSLSRVLTWVQISAVLNIFAVLTFFGLVARRELDIAESAWLAPCVISILISVGLSLASLYRQVLTAQGREALSLTSFWPLLLAVMMPFLKEVLPGNLLSIVGAVALISFLFFQPCAFAGLFYRLGRLFEDKKVQFRALLTMALTLVSLSFPLLTYWLVCSLDESPGPIGPVVRSLNEATGNPELVQFVAVSGFFMTGVFLLIVLSLLSVVGLARRLKPHLQATKAS